MLKVCEIFGPTIQGEGKSSGRACTFLRLALCNLHCVWCDTPYTWNFLGSKWVHPQKFDSKKEVHSMTPFEIYKQIVSQKQNMLVVSGGEPLLQQVKLVNLLHMLPGFWIEVETNGTIVPLDDIVMFVDQFNVSPKLTHSGDTEKLRIRPKALQALVDCGKANFKFVVSSHSDIDEIIAIVNRFGMKDVFLMPEGRTKEELNDHTEMVEKLCRLSNFSFTNRLSVLKAGTTRGV